MKRGSSRDSPTLSTIIPSIDLYVSLPYLALSRGSLHSAQSLALTDRQSNGNDGLG